MESAKTTIGIEIPIDGWSFDQDSVSIRVGSCSIRLPFPNRYSGIESPTLVLELKCHR